MRGVPGSDSSNANCVCGLPAPYDDCCGRFHRGDATAPTAERLMRSRFSAFGVGDEAYLLRTWHPSTRPPLIDFDPALPRLPTGKLYKRALRDQYWGDQVSRISQPG